MRNLSRKQAATKSLVGSSPTASAFESCIVCLADRLRHQFSKLDKRVRFPRHTSIAGLARSGFRWLRNLPEFRTPGSSVGSLATSATCRTEPGATQIKHVLAEQAGVLATLSRWRSGVQVPSRTLLGAVGKRKSRRAQTSVILWVQLPLASFMYEVRCVG